MDLATSLQDKVTRTASTEVTKLSAAITMVIASNVGDGAATTAINGPTCGFALLV